MLRHIAFIAFCFTSIARADFVVYGEAQRQAWFDATGGDVTTIHFNEYPEGTTIGDQYSNLGVTFQGLNFIESGSFDDNWGLTMIGVDMPGNDLYFDQPINWIATDYRGAVRYVLYSGDTQLFEFQRPAPDKFSGVTSDVGFDRVRIFDPTDPFTIIDDLHFGPPIAVPAPASFIAIALPLFLMRRRRR